MKLAVKNGITSLILRVKILDTAVTTGAGKTGLSHSSSGLIISTIADNEATATAYTQVASNVETITTLGTFAAPTSGKCRFKEVDATNHPGIYEIHIANARWAVSNARSVIVSISGVSGAAQVDAEIQLDPVPANVERFGDATGTFAGGRPEVNVTHAAGTAWNSGAITDAALAASAVTEIQSGLATAAALDAVDNFVDTEVAAIKSVTDKLDTALELDGSVYRYTVNALEQAPAGGGGGSTDWTADERTAIRTILGVPTSGTTPEVPSAGALKVIDDFIDTEVSTIVSTVTAIELDTQDIQSRLPAALVSGRIDASIGAAAANTITAAALASDAVIEIQSGLALASDLATIAAYIDTEIAAILADTNELQTDWTNGGRLDLLIDAIKAKTDNLPAAPAATGDIPTVSQIWTTALTEAFRATGATGTAAQLLYEILQNITEFTITGTTKTVKRLDGLTTAKTYTLNDGATPTGITEAT